LRDMYIDVAFLGTNGFSVERGFTTPDQAESTAKRAMVTASRRVIVVADSTKAGQVHLNRFADTAEVAMLVTDTELDDETAEDFDAAGVEVART
jgi:DeoR family transcriptional regulator, fructose operon transcriptional repressor